MIATALLLMSVYAHAQTSCVGVHHTSCEDPRWYDYFGVPAISGSWAVLGKSGHDGTEFSQGATHIYRKRNGLWEPHQLLVHPNPQDGPTTPPGDATIGEFLGESVAIDDRWVVGGAWGFNFKRGRLVVFERTYVNNEWVYTFSENLIISQSDGTNNQYLGGGAEFRKAIAISGGTIAGGAPYYRTGTDQVGQVGVWIWDSTNGWPTEQSQLFRSNTFGSSYPVEAEANFGASVAIDGEWMVIGEPGRDVGQTNDAGAVYIAHLDNGSWVTHSVVTSPTPVSSGRFGYSVAIEDDVIVVGAPSENSDSSGRVHIFRLQNGTWSAFGNPINHPDPEGSINDFGHDVSLSSPLLLIADKDYGEGENQGAAFLYQYDTNGNWNHVSTLLPDVSDSDVSLLSFADTIALSGSDAMVYSDRFSYKLNQDYYDANGQEHVNIGSVQVYRGLPTCNGYVPTCP